MTKSEIIDLLKEKHKRFLAVFPSLSEREFSKSVNGKWTAAQQLDHIIRSVNPVVFAFSLPVFVPKLLFGKANRPSRSYDALVEKYHTKLGAGGKASGRYIPKEISFQNRNAAMSKLNSLVQKLSRKVENKTEQDLDTYILPHPLLGKLTFREILYFTAYHAEHHEKFIKNNTAD